MATDYSVVDSLKISHLYFGSPHSRFRTGIIFDERGKFDEFYLQIFSTNSSLKYLCIERKMRHEILSKKLF